MNRYEQHIYNNTNTRTIAYVYDGIVYDNYDIQLNFIRLLSADGIARAIIRRSDLGCFCGCPIQATEVYL